MGIEVKDFGFMPDGSAVSLYILKNENGVRAAVTDYGATLTSLETPDENGVFDDIVLGYDDLAGYLSDEVYFGSTIGRFANRISGGEFDLDGKVFRLSANQEGNTLHGGPDNFSKRLWNADVYERNGSFSVRMRLTSHDGDQGFPGLLEVAVVYTITPENGLKIEYIADCDAPTVVNMTHHSYFNLGGASCGRDILDHELYIDSAAMLETNEKKIPSGNILPIAGTPFDFNVMKKIGLDIEHEKVKIYNGYDNTFILTSRDHAMVPAAVVIDRKSGRKMDVFTTLPSLQFYTGNSIDSSVPGRNNTFYRKKDGLCIEPQFYPDSPNNPQFPSTVLRPDEKYYEIIEYRFSII